MGKIDVKGFFKDLNQDIGFSRTKENLNLLKNRGSKFFNSVKSESDNPKVVRQARKKYVGSLKKIRRKSKQLRG